MKFPPFRKSGNAFPIPLQSKERLWAKVSFRDDTEVYEITDQDRYGMYASGEGRIGLCLLLMIIGSLERFLLVCDWSKRSREKADAGVRLDLSICYRRIPFRRVQPNNRGMSHLLDGCCHAYPRL